jgi:hypothetical protein
MAEDDGEERNCSSCDHHQPEVARDEADIFECLTLCETQLRMGRGGPVALDWSVIFRVADEQAIPIDDRFLRCLRVFEGTLMRVIGRTEGGDDG